MIKNNWLIVTLGILALIGALVVNFAPGKVRKDDTITINYTLTLDDGTVYDSTIGREPLTTTLGQGLFIASFEDELLGMRVGQSRTFTLPPEKAFGEYRSDLIGTVARNWLPEGVEPVVGKQLQTKLKDGTQTVVTIISFTDTTLTLDANHPLAGKKLTFQIELLAIAKKPIFSNRMNLANLGWVILVLGVSTIGFVIFQSKKQTRFVVIRKGLRPRSMHQTRLKSYRLSFLRFE